MHKLIAVHAILMAQSIKNDINAKSYACDLKFHNYGQISLLC